MRSDRPATAPAPRRSASASAAPQHTRRPATRVRAPLYFHARHAKPADRARRGERPKRRGRAASTRRDVQMLPAVDAANVWSAWSRPRRPGDDYGRAPPGRWPGSAMCGVDPPRRPRPAIGRGVNAELLAGGRRRAGRARASCRAASLDEASLERGAGHRPRPSTWSTAALERPGVGGQGRSPSTASGGRRGSTCARQETNWTTTASPRGAARGRGRRPRGGPARQERDGGRPRNNDSDVSNTDAARPKVELWREVNQRQ